MSESVENKLYKYFKQRRFSELSFLYDEAFKSKDPLHLGLLYFLMDSKNEDKTIVFNELEKVLGSKSSVYLSLSDLSTKVYDNHNFIFRSYVEHSLSLDSQNINSLFAMYSLTYDPKYILEILKIHNTNNDINGLTHALHTFDYSIPDNLADSNADCWNLIEEAYSKVDIESNKIRICALALAYLKLKKYDLGLALIKDNDSINHYVIKSYINKSLLTEDEGLEKVDLFFCDKITNDPQKIYKINKNHFDKNKANPTVSAIIKIAFDAKNYQDVVSYFNSPKYQNNSSFNDNSSIAYYLLANFFLTNKFDKTNYSKLSKSEIFFENDKTIVNIVECYNLLNNLEPIIQNEFDDGFFNTRIQNYVDYKSLDKILSQPDIIYHNLYQDLIKRKNSILDRDQERINQYIIKNSLTNDLDLEEPLIETLDQCGVLYHLKKFNELILALEKWHLTNLPSVNSYKYTADCYYELNDKNNMYKYYKLAYELSEKSKENNYSIAFKYLSSLIEMHPDKINEIESLKNKYNLDLASQFRIPYIDRKIFFKYCPFNINTIDALANQYFYFPDKLRLNDPIELPHIKYSEIPDDILSNYRIFSLSENNNSMLMWSHYANNHKGISIGYKFGDYLPHGVGISEVKYNNHLKRQADLNYLQNRYRQHLLTKNEDWSYERESRIFTTKEKIYYEKFDYLDYDRDKIDAYIFSITLGCAFPDDKLLLITQLISSINQRNLKNPKIILMKAEITKDNPFALEYKEVNY